MVARKDMKRISKAVWEIPPSYKAGMRVPARLYASEKLLDKMEEGIVEQVTNVAMSKWTLEESGAYRSLRFQHVYTLPWEVNLLPHTFCMSTLKLAGGSK